MTFCEKDLTGQIIAAAIEVHRELGPGLLESAYQACLAREFSVRGMSFEQEKPLPVEYKGVRVAVATGSISRWPAKWYWN